MEPLKKGSTNWLEIGRFSFQPTEIIKLLLIFLIASYYVNYDEYKEKKFGPYYLTGGAVYLFIGFLFLQKDLGTVLIFFIPYLLLFNLYMRKIEN